MPTRERRTTMTDVRNAPSLVGLRDEQDIRDLGYRFADACNRDDGAAFRELWTDDAVWIIDEPMNLHIEGVDAIAGTRARLRSMWSFFVQMPHAPVVAVDTDRATSSWTVSEHAVDSTGGRTYFNYARYDDVLIRTTLGWRYVSRRYRYYHLEQTGPDSDVAAPTRPGPGIH